MKKRLGNRVISSLKPSNEPYEVVDADLRGFSLRVMPSGTMTYYVRYRLPDGKRQRLKLGNTDALTPAQARDMAKQSLADALRGDDPVAAKRNARAHTVESFVMEVYGPWLLANRKSGAQVSRVLLTAFPALLRRKLQEVTAWDVEKWRRQALRKGLTTATTNRYLAYLKAMFQRAYEWDFLAQYPLTKVKQNREDNSRVRYLDPEEERRLMDTLDAREERIRQERDSANVWRRERGYEEFADLRKVAYVNHLKPMILLSLNTGLRRGELFSLQWQDVRLDVSSPTLTVRAQAAKSGKTRHIPLNRTALSVLKSWREQTMAEGLVFVSHKTGRRFDNCNKAWREVLAEAKIGNFRWHDMRHHFASRLVMAGADLYVVKELLGHSSIQMTERYAHLAPAVKAAAVALLDEDEHEAVVPLAAEHP